MFIKLPIKDQHEIINNSNLPREDKVFAHNYITQNVQKPQVEKEVREFKLNLKQKCIVAWFLFVFLLIVVGGILNQVNANKEGICNSDKCWARLGNIKGCEKKYTEVKDIVLCATQKVVRTRKNEMTVNDFRTTREDIENLYKIYKDESVGFDIDKLAYAVAMAETGNCKKGYGKTHNNCFGIKHGNTAPCPGVAKGKMCKYKTPEESYVAFKKIWGKWYKTYPNYKLADTWTGGDRTESWLEHVSFYYNQK